MTIWNKKGNFPKDFTDTRGLFVYQFEGGVDVEEYDEACEWFLNWAKEQKIPMKSISDDDLSGIYAQIECNYTMNNSYMSDLPDIEE